MRKSIGEYLNESRVGIITSVMLPFLLAVWPFFAGIFEIGLFVSISVSILLLVCSIIITVCQRNYNRIKSKDYDEYIRLQKIHDSNTRIREGNYANLVAHINDNFRYGSFVPIITDPRGQLIRIQQEFQTTVLDFFDKTDAKDDVETRLGYRIPFLEGSSGEWKLIDGAIYSSIRSFHELANDPRSTINSVIEGDESFAFNPIKNKVVIESIDEAWRLGRNAKRYVRHPRDANGLPGSIMAKHFVVGGDNGTKYIEAVLVLATFSNPLIGDSDTEEFKRKEEVLKSQIVGNYVRKMEDEFALFFIQQMNELKCFICGNDFANEEKLIENKGIRMHYDCVDTAPPLFRKSKSKIND